MRKPSFLLPAALAIVACLGASGGCSVSTDENDKSKKHDVDIHTPFGSLSVREGSADVKATGLALYPGARVKKDSDNESRSAKVDITSSFFGVNVVAVKFVSDDAPDKVLAFYRNEMAKYGTVVECAGGSDLPQRHEGNAAVRCEATDAGRDYRKELKVGTENNQRIVAVKPSGSGSEFALVYFRSS